MNIEKALSSGLINISHLARCLWPDIKNPVVKLQNKIDCRQGQRITEKDKSDIEVILKSLIED